MFGKIKKFSGHLIDKAGGSGLAGLVLLLVPATLFLPKLGSLVPTNSVFEKLEYLEAESGQAFYGNMLEAPMRVAQYATSLISDDVFYLRLLSVIAATVASVCLYLVIKRMFTTRIAALATLMFITSSWVLHAGRFANVEVLYLLVIPALFLIGSWLTSKADDNKLPLSVVLLAIILYIPGTWLFLLGGTVIFRGHFKRIWSKVSLKLRLASLGLLAGLLTPLLASFTQRPQAITEWLGISDYASLSLHEIASNLIAIPDALFLGGPDNSFSWLSGTPVLDYFAVAMFIIGCFAYRIGSNPKHERLIFSSLLMGIILVAAGGTMLLGLIIPLIYIIVANGIAYMLQSWFTVFPRNPLARSIGLSLLIVAVLVSSSYQLQRYFIAWPNSQAVEQLRQ